jgi:hypothetical protein
LLRVNNEGIKLEAFTRVFKPNNKMIVPMIISIIGNFFHEKKLVPRPTKNKTGKVHSAKAHIIRPPVKKSQLEIAISCAV